MRRPLRTTLRDTAPIHVALLGLVYVTSFFSFVSAAGAISTRFSTLALGPFLPTLVLAHVRLLPAYFVVGLTLVLLTAPALRYSLGPSPSRARLVAHTLTFDALVLVLALGPALQLGPGVFDTLARKLPHLDLYRLAQWHGLAALTVAFAALVLWALVEWFGARARYVLIGLGLCGAYLAAPPRRANVVDLVKQEKCTALLADCASDEPRCAQLRHACGVGPEALSVLVLASDSWRYDRVGIHGAREGLTPHLDAFARQAIDLRGMHVATASTLESWTTLLTGLWPRTHGLRSMYPSRDEVRGAEARPSLPGLLNGVGYDAFVSSDWVGNCFALVDLGFTSQHVGAPQTFDALMLETTVRAHPLVPLFFGALSGTVGDVFVPGRDSFTATARPSVLTEQLFDDLDSSVRAGRPFFGVLFTSPTHLPYNARYPFNVKYADPAYNGPHRYQVEVSAHELITTGFSPTLAPSTVQHVRDLYDGAVSDFDDTVGAVLDELEVRGLAKSTIVIITSDHGEDLYEPGSTLGHGTNFFGGDQSTQVPFLVRVPTRDGFLNPGASVDAITRTVDVMPTVLELLGFEVPKGLDGVSLLPLLTGARRDLSLIAFAETCYLFFPKSQAMTGLSKEERAEVVELAGAADTLEVDSSFNHNLVLKPALREAAIAAKDRMVRSARFKLIEIPGRTRAIRRLYDMAVDRHQQHDLAGQGLAAEAELTAALDRQR